MNTERKDGVPFVPTKEEIAALMKGEPPPEPTQEAIERVPLTDEEAGALFALLACRQSIDAQMDGALHGVANRLVVNRNLLVEWNSKEKWIAVRREAPKAN